MATWWRLESPLVAEMSPRRLLETSRVSGESREIQTCSICGDFFQSPAGLGDVSATSPSVAATSRRLILSASATGETSPRPAEDQGDWGDVAATFTATMRRRLRDAAWPTRDWARAGIIETPSLLVSDVALARAQAIFWSPESPELPRLISRGSCGDVSANEIGP